MGTIQPRIFPAIVLFLWVAALCGCGSGETPRYISMGTAPVGGTFPVVGGAMAEVLNVFAGDNHWKVQIKGSKGTQENIRRLHQGQFQLGMSNSAIGYFAVRGESGWDNEKERGGYPIRTVATLASLVAVFITKIDSGIDSIADLKGKRVVVGPAGAGFEMFVEPLLAAHGVPWDSFTPLNDPQGVAVDRLGDGAADAIFLGGAVPHPSIIQAMGGYDVKFIPYDDAACKQLVKDFPFFQQKLIPVKTRGKRTYKGMKEPFSAMIVGSMQLITHRDADEELIYQITKTLYEAQNFPVEKPAKEFSKRHPVGNALNPKNAARFTGVPFHRGAIRFYESVPGIRKGVWEDPAKKAASAK